MSPTYPVQLTTQLPGWIEDDLLVARQVSTSGEQGV
jgi:hypothetical protein